MFFGRNFGDGNAETIQEIHDEIFMDEFEPLNEDWSKDSVENDWDFAPQTPPDTQPSTSTQNQSVSGGNRGKSRGRGASRGRGRGCHSTSSTTSTTTADLAKISHKST